LDTKDLVKSEVEKYAEFNLIRYAQVWEDADVLLKALKIDESDNILSIASAGENILSMLLSNPNKIYAIDLNKNQIACFKFKIACYKYLKYEECMELIGVFDSSDRLKIYKKIEEKLSDDVKAYFDKNIEFIKMRNN
jgi:S-adenosylmethionine-diacylglycerol 3-amino-3-carboxypropyl transferase